MPHRKDLKSVVHNFLGTYTSRYSDNDGWWVFGLAEPQLTDARLDLLSTLNNVHDPLSAATQLAQLRFSEQLAKAKIPGSFVREAHLTVTRSPEPSRGQVNGRWCDGHIFTFAVRVVSDHGRHSRRRDRFLWRHTMQRSNCVPPAAPNQPMERTADRCTLHF